MLIYKITNTINGKFYVGKTERTLRRRFQLHKSSKDESYLHRAMRKDGSDNFIIETIEEVKGDLNERERYWIAKLSPEYNMTKGGDGGDTSQSPNYKEGMKKRDLSGPKNGMYGKPSAMRGKTHPCKGKPLRGNMCPVMCEGIEYESVGAAQDAYPGIKVRYRLDSLRYPDFYRLRPRTLRKELHNAARPICREIQT